MTGERDKTKQILVFSCSGEIVSEVEQLAEPYGYVCRQIAAVSELMDSMEERETVILLDASDFEVDYPQRIAQIHEQAPQAGVLALLPDDSMSYCKNMLESGADIAFATEELKRLLVECLGNLHEIHTDIDSYEESVTSKKEEKQMTKKNGILQTPISRRSFLKGSMAATAAVGAMSMFGCSAPVDETTAGTTPAETIPETTPEAPSVPVVEEQVYCGVCRGNCAAGCFLNVHVRDGKVVRTSMREMPDERYNRICIKGLTQPYRMYNPDRLKYPMRRVGERGAGQWEQITWDEAIKEITDKWKGYQAEYGTQSVAIYKGSGNFATVNGVGMGSAYDRFKNVIGASTIGMDVDAANVTGVGPVIGRGIMASGNEAADLLNAKTIIVWGANPVNSQQQTTHFMLEAKENGTNLIVIDPILTGTAAKADIYVPIRPGSDAAMAMAMMNIAIRDDLVDWDFVKKHTDAMYLIKTETKKYLRVSDLHALAEGEKDEPVVMGSDGVADAISKVADPVVVGTFEINGHEVVTAYDFMRDAIKEYTPEKAAEICNIPVDQIEQVAKLYATDTPSTIYAYFGVDHYVNGIYGYRAFSMLAALTGNLGKPGAYVGMNESMPTNVVNFAVNSVEGGIPSTVNIPFLRLPEVLEEKSFRGTDVNIKALYMLNGNLIGNGAERQTTLDSISKIDFFVVADMSMTESAQMADIVLPVAHWFEAPDVFGAYSTHPYILMQDKVAEIPYECKTDYEIYRLLSEAMGYPDAFKMTDEEYMKEWMNSDGARAVGLTWEALQEKKAIRFTPTENHVYAEGGVFGTATGRANFFNENPAVAVDFGQPWEPDHERTAFWEPPYEAWHENPKHEKYPFNLIQVHPKWRTHSQWFDVPVLNEVSGDPTMHINPVDAAAKGIQTGDIVKIFNDRGYVVMKADINNGVQPGTVTVPKGWEKGQFIEGHYQDLTMRVMHPMINNSGFFDVLVDVEKM